MPAKILITNIYFVVYRSTYCLSIPTIKTSEQEWDEECVTLVKPQDDENSAAETFIKICITITEIILMELVVVKTMVGACRL